MKHGWLLLLFIFDLLAELLAIEYSLHSVRLATKPLLMTCLVVYTLVQHFADNNIKRYLLLALLFSLAGDLFLLFDKEGSSNFIYGLLSFLLAHLFYILLFIYSRKKQMLKGWNPLVAIILLIYVASFFYLLSPKLGSLKIPVLIYALVLGAMLLCAWHAFDRKHRIVRQLVLLGAVLFVLSDSLLAINKFYHAFPYSGIAVMTTYALAQLLITIGITTHARSLNIP